MSCDNLTDTEFLKLVEAKNRRLVELKEEYERSVYIVEEIFVKRIKRGGRTPKVI